MNEWKKSDFLEGAIFREADGFMEIYEVWPDRNNVGYSISHGLLSFDSINLAEVMETFGCASIPDLKEALGTDWKQIAILAWFDLAFRNEDTYLVCRGMFHDYNEAVRQMYRMAGCREGDEGLEISCILVISTAHISPQTARLMDAGAINAGFYSAYEHGYQLLTVEWENYKDIMPDDLKDCVKFAAEHGCDWLCLNSDANPVPNLPVYEWDQESEKQTNK